MNFDSPNTAMALAAMASDMALDNGQHGGSLHAASFSGLQPNGAIDQDAVKLGRLNSIMSILGQVKGRVSEDGIERLARKIGMECLWDTGFGANPTKTLIIAGTGMSIDIEFLNGSVQSVAVSFPEGSDAVQSHAKAMGDILHENLKDDAPGGKGMINFDRNLQRLATLDKLSVGNQFNCFEAIEGIYKSLDRLHKFEIEELMKREAGMSAQEAEKIITTTSSGRPQINTRGNVGLSLDYFIDRGETSDKTWSVLVECESSPSMVYPPARVSDSWISEQVVQSGVHQPTGSQQTTEFVMDWQQPENTLLPSTQDSSMGQDIMAGLQTEKLPDARFVAHFDPPLLIPHDVRTRISQTVGIENNSIGLSTFDELLSSSSDTANTKTPNWRSKSLAEDQRHHQAYRCLRRERQFKVNIPEGETISRLHRTSLYFNNRDRQTYCSELTELPFSHPSQLVDLLPTLRQWAHAASLLEKVLHVSRSQQVQPRSDEDDEDDWDSCGDDDDFLVPPKKDGVPRSDGIVTRRSHDQAVYIDIQLLLTSSDPNHPSPSPKIDIHFEVRRPDGKDYQIGIPVHIAWNGQLRGIEQYENKFVHGSHGDLNMRPGKQHEMVKILAKAGDIGTWVEFLKTNKVTELTAPMQETF